MSYFRFGTFKVAGVFAIEPMFMPCRSKMQDAPAGLVTTEMSCEVPSVIDAHPNSPKLRAHSPVMPNFIGCPTRYSASIQADSETLAESGVRRKVRRLELVTPFVLILFLVKRRIELRRYGH